MITVVTALRGGFQPRRLRQSAGLARSMSAVEDVRRSFPAPDGLRSMPVRSTDEEMDRPRYDLLESLDWSSIGRLVRVRTLEAVSLHCAVMADRACTNSCESDDGHHGTSK